MPKLKAKQLFSLPAVCVLFLFEMLLLFFSLCAYYKCKEQPHNNNIQVSLNH
jgi:hypothetical protein